MPSRVCVDCMLPPVETHDAILGLDVLHGTEEGGFLPLFGLDLDDDLDHIDGLNDAGSHHPG